MGRGDGGPGPAPARVGIFPFVDRLNMWRLPPRQLQASLHALAKTEHRFYDVLQRGLLHLLIDAPEEGLRLTRWRC